MSKASSWPSSHAVSREDSDVEPKFEQPEHFHRTSGKGGWFCSACAPSHDAHLHSFNAMAAIRHERSQSHKDTVTHLTPWGTNEADYWGPLLAPYEQLRYSYLSREDPLKKRVKRWIRDIARAEGIEIEEEEEPEEGSEHARWNDWGAGGNDWGAGGNDWGAGDDWQRPTEEWGFPKDPRPADRGDTDPRAVADFKFVEKVARARGMKKDRRRLHAFYRLPTDEKISRIQEIVHFISAH